MSERAISMLLLAPSRQPLGRSIFTRKRPFTEVEAPDPT